MLHRSYRGTGLARASAAAVFVAVLAALLAASSALAPPASAGPGPIPDTLWSPPAGSVPDAVNSVYLVSDPGEYVGAGKTYLHTSADSLIRVSATGGHLTVSVDGDQWWEGDFQAMAGLTALEPGYYPGVTRYPFHDPATGGLDWSGESRGMNILTGWFAVDGVTYTDGQLTALDLRFEQRSSATMPALHGAIHWRADDPTQPPGPVVPVPDGLWQPPAGAVPDTINSIYLDSEPGDLAGAGKQYLCTQANSMITVSATGGHLSVVVDGDMMWRGDVQTMRGLTALEQGYYPDAQRYPAANPTRSGLSWGAASSDSVTGWFAIDAVTYTDGVLTAIDLRFEQQYNGAAPALHGAVHWRSDDPTKPPGPVLPIPDTLWKPAAGSVPSTGNFVCLDSEGDYVVGRDYLYTQADAVLTVSAGGGHLTVRVDGDQKWYGDFQAMTGLSELQPGYYPGLRRYPFHDPVKGGLSWWGEGRGLNELTGWFAVDDVVYTDGVLTAIDLRFGQTTTLHGAIHWRADDETAPPGPVLPVPSGLWKPAAGSVPSLDTYVYLDSDAGDYVGRGDEYLYQEPWDTISVTATGGRLQVRVDGEESWSGDFQTMADLSALQPGYYPDLRRYPFHNPARGGLAWFGEGRGLNTLSGWFAVDSVTYEGGSLAAIDLRFEQRGSATSPALHGAIHWEKYVPSSISGTVRAADHSGLADVDVVAYRADGFGDWEYFDDALTQEDGSYELADLRRGEYRLEFFDFSGACLGQWYDGKPDLQSATGIVVAPGSATSDVDVTLRWAGHISGTLTDSTTQGAEDVGVTAYRSDGYGGWAYVNDTSTAADGTYDLGGLDTGVYRIEFRDWSGAYVPEWYDDQTGPAAAVDVPVTAGATTTGVNAALMEASHITGTVRDSAQAARGDIYVTAYRADGSGGWVYAADTFTAEDGGYDLGGLPGGTYRVEFEDWSEDLASQWYQGKEDLASATDIIVGARAVVRGIDATLTTPGHITGTVTGPGNSGLEDIMVIAYRQDGRGVWQPVLSTWTTWDGKYELGVTRAGSYRLQFVDYSGVYGARWYGDKARLAESPDVLARLGFTTTGVDAKLLGGGHITGTVRTAGRTGLSGIDVTAYQPDGFGGWIYLTDVVTGRDGTYDLGGLGADVYRIGFDDLLWRGYAPQYYDNAPSLASCDEVAVTVGIPSTNVDAILGIPNGDKAPPTTLVAGADAPWCKSAAVTLTALDGAGGSGVDRIEYRPHGTRRWSLYVSPLLIATEGTTTYDYRSVDAAQNAEPVRSFTVNVDSTAPTVSATGAADGQWLGRAATVSLAGSDSAGGSGVASVTYTLDGVAHTIAGATAQVPLPETPNGVHVLTFSVADRAGNVSGEQMFTLRVDTTGPVTLARAAAGRKGRAITLRYRANDNLSPQVSGVAVVVRNARYRAVRTFARGTRAAGAWYSLRWKPSAKGVYRYSVYATDLAGKKQSKVGTARIVVR